MTAKPLLALVLLLTAGCASQRDAAQSEGTSEPIFRYVDLGSLGRFELGEPFGDHARLAVAEGPNAYRLRKGAFGGAESIVVTTDESGIVRRINFEYGPGYDWTDLLSNYTESLGPPTQADGGEAVWNDGRTEFSLTRQADASYAAGAEMRDLTGST